MFNKKLTKKEENLMGKLFVSIEKQEVKNPLSGASETLDPEAVALYDFIIGCNMVGAYPSDYHVALDLFRKQWPDEYMTLLD